MRRGFVPFGLLALGAAALVQSAAAQNHRAALAGLRQSVTLKVALPQPDSAGIAVLQVETIGRKSAIRVSGLNENNLPPGIRAIAIVRPRESHASPARFTVYVAVNNLSPRPSPDVKATPDFGHLEIELRDPFGLEKKVVFTDDLRFPQDCNRLKAIGDFADGPARGLIGLYPLAKQQSDPEEILDHLAYDRYHCAGAEVPELGPR